MGISAVESQYSYIKANVDVDLWQDLARNVEKHAPDIIILVARKMTRLWQLLKLSTLSERLKNTPVYSDFALDFMERGKLKDKKVAIVDDAVNVGTTLVHICKLLQESGATPECFTMAHKDTFNSKAFQWPLYVTAPEPIRDEDQYRGQSARLNMALLLSAMPLEIEYPSYRILLSDGVTSEDFMQNLAQGAGERLQWLTCLDAEERGFLRAALLIEHKEKVQAKIRLYVDKNNDELICAPMPFSTHPHRGSDRINRKALFNSGEKLMHEQFDIFKRAGARYLEPVKEDGILLFGPNNPGEMVPSHKSLIGQTIPDSFIRDALSGCASFIEKFSGCERTDSLRLLVIDIFRTFAQFTGADNPQDIDQDFMNLLPTFIRVQLEEDNFARLRLGLSFEDIIFLVRTLNTKFAQADFLKLSRSVSRLLDEHIDQGFIVPVIDLAGRRSFRKGEPWPHDRAFLYSLQCQGESATPGDNLEKIFHSMSPSRKRKCLALLKEIEESEV